MLLATGKYVGEGFDDARLDTLFLTLPVSWRGTVAQYAGRLHSLYDGKREVRIYEYAGLITTAVKNSCDQEVVVVPIVDDMTLNDERPNAFAELRPIPTHARLFDEQLESIEDGIDQSIGGFEAGIFRDVGPDVVEVLLGKRG